MYILSADGRAGGGEGKCSKVAKRAERRLDCESIKRRLPDLAIRKFFQMAV
ncbi:MAG: hypothetical protein IJX91_04515 [Clostridia bacterium]|nr:hypothetical protein [Clostridia bacterium]